MSRELKEKPSVLVVCMGNICRSPTGEAVLKKLAADRGVDILVDSAGTINYHQGSSPDPRSVAAGEARGYSFSGMHARQVEQSDFARFDLILAADRDNLNDLLRQCPAEYRHKVTLFLSHGNSETDEVPDPYFGGSRGFENVLDLIEDAAESILDKLSPTASAG
ncbi:low molecular weight protein-tyrosine-phosphatase [Veronia pacifica]|uniref:protein-tyrosine-phosphatase n=1 Tax=Veronia pacifica TaxID=1080227 RepID=A0A1C3EM07_9GAMM|nr:low molecular weight protein-tyrosine-phosphatase [Veronia pacifica]ODA34287.1 protein-tyrosine-phosphatase [Veronia pacifica]